MTWMTCVLQVTWGGTLSGHPPPQNPRHTLLGFPGHPDHPFHLGFTGHTGHSGHPGHPGCPGHLDDVDILNNLDDLGDLGGLRDLDDLGDLVDLRFLGNPDDWVSWAHTPSITQALRRLPPPLVKLLKNTFCKIKIH